MSANDFAMKPRSVVDIPSGEALHYGVFEGGERVQEFRMISFFEGDSAARAYIDFYHLDSKKPAPSSYKEFLSYSVVDLKNASIISYHMDDYEYQVKQKKVEGAFTTDITYNGTTLTHISREWDGNEIHEAKSEFNDIEAGYPVWPAPAFMLWGGRVLEWNEGGSILTIVPGQKRPFKSYIVIEGEETISTPAGRFETTKLRWRVSNFFLDLLMRVMTDKIYMWVEKGPKHRLIKMITPGDHVWILEEAKIVK
jgi:hypothetical protein